MSLHVAPALPLYPPVSDISCTSSTQVKTREKIASRANLDGITEPNTSSTDGEKKAPTKKRVRREKVELEFLRRESKRLGDEVAQLRELRGQHIGSTEFQGANDSKSHHEQLSLFRTHGYRFIAPRKQVKRFVWQQIAERQFKERRRAESQNEKLRDQLVVNWQLGKQLHVLLQRHPVSEYILALNPPLTDNDAVFKYQLSRAENTLMEIEDVLRSSAFKDPDVYFVHAFEEKLDDSRAFVMQSNVLIPFEVEVVENALWNLLGGDRFEKQCYDYQVAIKSDTVVARSFGIHSAVNGVDVDFRVQYTLCRFKDSTRTVVVWVVRLEPVQVAGLSYRGIRTEQSGWVQISSRGIGDLNYTHARSQSRLKVEVENDANDSELEVRSLLDLAKPMHEQLYGLCSSILEVTLVEEDWKLNGCAGQVAV